MKKTLLTILFTLVLSGGASAENLFLTCKYKNQDWGTMIDFEFDLKNKKYIALGGNKIDIAYTEDEIIFQTYLGKDTMFSIEINRNNGQGSIKDFDYLALLEKENELWGQMALSVLRYPNLSDGDKKLFSIRDYASKTFTPRSMSEIDCTKLEKSF